MPNPTGDLRAKLANGTYPNITKATLEISYDNNGIRRDRTEGDVKKLLGEFLSAQAIAHDLPAIEAWLGGLSEDDLLTFCTGEHSDINTVAAGAPGGCRELFDDIFEEVA